MHYRKEIDGLRAIAVIPVILFHMGFETFSGGFVGVDVFFVISGFLITSLIISDIDNQRFSLLNFYERRARRILPALFFVMLVCVPLAWVSMVPFQLHDFSQSLVATLAFASNFLFFIESGYFEPEAELKPLLHTWSLAVEEQYYIVFPVLVLMLCWMSRLFARTKSKTSSIKPGKDPVNSTGKKLIFSVCGFIALLSFAWSQLNVVHEPAAAFFLLPSRAWEILAGAMAALYLNLSSSHKRRFSSLAKQILCLIGITCIVVPVFLYDDSTLFPGINAIFPVVGVVLLLVYTSPGTPIHLILSQKALVGIGLISYSAYLWHQPLIAFSRLRYGMDLSLNQSVLILSCTGLLSILSWRYIETPARRSTTFKFLPLAAVCACPIVVIVLFALSGLQSNGFYNTKLAEIPSDYKRYIVDQKKEYERRLAVRDTLPDIRIQPFEDTSNSKKVLIVGDSISDDLLMSLNANKAHFQDYQFRRLRLDDVCVTAASIALSNRETPSHAAPTCVKEVSLLLATELYRQAEEVVLHSNFQLNNANSVEAFVRGLIVDGKKVSVVGTLVFNDVASVAMKLHRSAHSPNEIFFAALRGKYLVVNDRLKTQVNRIPGAKYFDKFSLFCSQSEKRCNILDNSDSPIFIDGNHMTVNGHTIFGQKISEAGWF